MKTYFRWVGVAIVAAVAAGLVGSAHAQVNPRDVPLASQPQQRFDGGQDIQPIFEGWTRRDDGGYLFHFGYLNRNYREQPSISVGPDNYFSPGDEDRGQPTHFYPRTQTLPVHDADAGRHRSQSRGRRHLVGDRARQRAAGLRVAATGVGDRREHHHVELAHRIRTPAGAVVRQPAAGGGGVGERRTGRRRRGAHPDGGDSRRRVAVGAAAASAAHASSHPDSSGRHAAGARQHPLVREAAPAAQRSLAALDRLPRPGRRRFRAGRFPALRRGAGTRAGGRRRVDRADLVRQSGDAHRRRRLDLGDLRGDRHVRLARHLHAAGPGRPTRCS